MSPSTHITAAKILEGVLVTFSDGSEIVFTDEQYAELLAGIVAKECRACPKVKK